MGVVLTVMVWCAITAVTELVIVDMYCGHPIFSDAVTRHAPTESSSPLKIEILASPRSCLQIQQAEFSTYFLVVFVKRICGSADSYSEAHYKVFAKDGTVIDSGFTNWQVDRAEPGGRSEWDILMKPDARAARVTMWTKDDAY